MGWLDPIRRLREGSLRESKNVSWEANGMVYPLLASLAFASAA